MKRLFLLLLVVLIAGCADVPEGPYLAYPGTPDSNATIVATVFYQGYSVYILSGAPGFEPTVDHSTAVPPIPTTVKACELLVQGASHILRNAARDGGAFVANIPAGSRLVGLQFFYPIGGAEWAQVRFGALTGWILVTSNILYDGTGPCLDVPSTHEVPIPTAQPTATAQPSPTPIQPLYKCTAGDYGVNVREEASTSSSILGVLLPGQRVLVKTQWYNTWWQVAYKGGTAYLHGDFVRTCETGAIQ